MTTPTPPRDALTDERIDDFWRVVCDTTPSMISTRDLIGVFARAIEAEVRAALAPAAPAAVAQAQQSTSHPARDRKIKVEQMIRDCVPGGSWCDPQQVADSLREWAAREGK